MQAIVRWLPARYGVLSADILVDGSTSGTRARPPCVGVFVPDVFVPALQERPPILGEAKTPLDLETARSVRQLAEFLSWCRPFPGATVVLAVPWDMVPRGRNLLRHLRTRAQAPQVNIEVLENLW